MFEGLKKRFSGFIGSLSNKEADKTSAIDDKGHEEKNANAVSNAAEKTALAIDAPVEAQGAIPAAKNGDMPAGNLSAEENEPKHELPDAALHKNPRISASTKIKGFVFGKVKISQKDADPFIDELRIGLLQSDVNYDVADRLTEGIRQSLVGREVRLKDIEADIRQSIRSSIYGILAKESAIDIAGLVEQKRMQGQLPVKILFIGPNGAGKTTTMAKVAKMLISSGITCMLSASDTFRAAAIEQTVHHANALGIEVVKGTYGADPASVAFDAIAHAKARGISVVLIDSAGRQETNKSLVEELKKICRVTNPDLKIFVGEGISGNALLDQVRDIDASIKIDGIILTKIDVDAKGGNTISILSETSIPILFFCTGEKYTDIMRYNPDFVIDNILPAS